MSEMITLYRGRNVEELSRDELIEAVKMLARALSTSYEMHRATMDVMCHAKLTVTPGTK